MNFGYSDDYLTERLWVPSRLEAHLHVCGEWGRQMLGRQGSDDGRRMLQRVHEVTPCCSVSSCNERLVHLVLSTRQYTT